MALETVVFEQDPLSYRNSYSDIEQGFSGYNWTSPLSSTGNTSFSSPDVCTGNGEATGVFRPVGAPAPAPSRPKRRRANSLKNKEEIENQRMTHIAVERNRRRQMNDYLAVLRSLMPPSYAQRGDQASIVGGAINFVKELEQLLQFLEAHKQVGSNNGHPSTLFANFFTSPIHSTIHQNDQVVSGQSSTIADIEVTMNETHAHIKVLSRRQPKQLLKIVSGFQSVGLTILHLNVTTTVDHMALYSFSVKVGDDCQLSTVNEIATIVHEMMGKIQEEAMSS